MSQGLWFLNMVRADLLSWSEFLSEFFSLSEEVYMSTISGLRSRPVLLHQYGFHYESIGMKDVERILLLARLIRWLLWCIAGEALIMLM